MGAWETTGLVRIATRMSQVILVIALIYLRRVSPLYLIKWVGVEVSGEMVKYEARVRPLECRMIGTEYIIVYIGEIGLGHALV